MRTELKRIGALKEHPDNRLEVVKRDFVPSGLDERLVLGFDSILQSAAETLAYNCDPANADNLFFQQLWGVDTISPEHFPEIRRKARDRLSELGHSFDDYLAEYQNDSDTKDSAGKEVGVGLYYYEMPRGK